MYLDRDNCGGEPYLFPFSSKNLIMKIKLTLIFFSLINALSFSQGLPIITPPPPNAAALAQYADTPISNYTGVPNISIPLFNLESGKIKPPITLSYHSSGIKVAQEASFIGLGWTLNAGGLITRQVRGLDDFGSSNGYGLILKY